MTPVFELKNVNYYYDHKKVLENINIKINKGEFLAIVGPNGAGKTTLFNLLTGVYYLYKVVRFLLKVLILKIRKHQLN